MLDDPPDLYELKKDVYISFSVPIHLENLDHFIDSSEKYVEEAKILKKTANNSTYPLGMIPQNYSVSKSGRYYAYAPALQRTPKILRNALMAGYWNVDIQCCHPTILSQQKGDYPMLTYYSNNTKEMRHKLAEEIGITYALIKQVLNAAFYGAGSSSSHWLAIPKLVGSKNSRKFWEHPIVSQPVGEAKKAGKVLNEKYGVDVGATQAKSTAHWCQNTESKMLEVRVKYEDVCVLLHDGMIVKEKVDIEDMEMRILEATGYAVKLDQEQVEYI